MSVTNPSPGPSPERGGEEEPTTRYGHGSRGCAPPSLLGKGVGGLGCLLLVSSLFAASPTRPADGQPANLVLEDQFERRQDLAAYRGEVVVLVYGDRQGTDACRELGEKLHVLFHPTAVGQPGVKARTAPVAPLAGVPEGGRSPDVVVVPVACASGVPGVIRDLIRSGVKKASPDVPVWLDFAGAMEKDFGLRAGEPNIAVFDAAGRLRFKVNGSPDQPSITRLLQAIQNLRAEAAGLAK